MEKQGEDKPQVFEATYYRTTIKEWPENERPREKLLHSGAQTLTEAELLAILIRVGIRGATAVDIAKKLLSEGRTLRTLARMSVGELQQYGLGKSKAITLAAAFELARRFMATEESLQTIQSPEDVAHIMAPVLRDLRHEEFWALLLTSSNALISRQKITVGILNSSLVHPRECYAEAIVQRAAAVIFVHNHPSGNPEPSREDIEITHQLVEAGKILGITLHDHIIIAGNSFVSFNERNLLR